MWKGKRGHKLDFTFGTHHLDSAELTTTTTTMMQIKLRPASPPAMSCHTSLLSLCAFTYMEVSSIRLSAGRMSIRLDHRHFADPYNITLFHSNSGIRTRGTQHIVPYSGSHAQSDRLFVVSTHSLSSNVVSNGLGNC